MGLLRDALETHERATASEHEAGDALREAREKRETRRARLDSLRELTSRHEDVGEAARRLLEAGESTRRRFGLHGLLRDLLEVDGDAEVAVEAVLAERAGALVVENVVGAVQALDALREEEAGRALFVTLPDAEPATSGFVPMGEPLLDRVRPRPGY